MQRPVTAQALNSTTALSLRDRLDSLDSATELIAEQEAIRKFYEERTFAPLWFTPDGPTDAARRVMRELEQADSWGLRVDDFALSEAARADGPRDDDQLAAAEFELSTLVLKYARHASGGRISEPERQLSDYIDRRAEVPSPADVLKQIAQAAAPEDVLRSYHPQHDQFQRLRALYVKLRGPAADAAKFVIASTGKLLAPGDTSPEIEALRGRLGVPATAGKADVYDALLLEAVKAFQRANRLSADGYVGPRTRAAFQRGDNEAQIRQILVSMEQWRWMPRDLGQRHVLVNIPAYSISFVEGGKSVMNERVIVGRPDTPTPVFSKPMSTIVLKPSWILPDSIKREKLLRGRSLEGQGLVVKKGDRSLKSWAVDWSKANLSHYAIYQPSGNGNALGSVKFLFPNKYSVYLHDTPNESLFLFLRTHLQPRLHPAARSSQGGPVHPRLGPGAGHGGRQTARLSQRARQQRDCADEAAACARGLLHGLGGRRWGSAVSRRSLWPRAARVAGAQRPMGQDRPGPAP